MSEISMHDGSYGVEIQAFEDIREDFVLVQAMRRVIFGMILGVCGKSNAVRTGFPTRGIVLTI